MTAAQRGRRVAAVAVLVLSAAALAQPASGPAQAAALDAAALARAEALVKDIFKADYAKTDPADRVALAQRLLAQARQGGGEPAEQFILLREARDVATRAGDVATAFAAIDESARLFGTRSDILKVGVLTQAAAATRDPALAQGIVEQGSKLLAAALAAEDLDSADAVLTAMEQAAKSAQNADVLAQVQARRRELKALQADQARLKPVLDKLASDPADPAANLVLGRYHLAREDWPKALPCLARVADADLKSAATQDLAKPAEPGAQQLAAEAWLKVAAKETGKAKAPYQARAAYWLRQAIPGLTGLRKTLAEQKLAELSPAGVPLSSPSPPPAGASPASAPSSPPTASQPAQAILRHLWTYECAHLNCPTTGRLAVYLDGDTVRVLDLATGKFLRSIAISGRGMPRRVAVTADGRRVAVLVRKAPPPAPRRAPNQPAPPAASPEEELVLYDVAGGQELGRRDIPLGSESSAALGFSADGRRLLAALQDGTTLKVRLVDLLTAREVPLAALDSSPTRAVGLSADGRLLAIGLAGQNVAVLDTQTGREVHRVTSLGFDATALAILPDNGRVLAAGGRAAKVLDLATGQPVATLAGAARFSHLALSPDGQRAGSIEFAGDFAVWDLTTGQVLMTGRHPGALDYLGCAFSDGGQWFVTAVRSMGTKEIRVWPVAK